MAYKIGAGGGNRTPTSSLGSSRSATKLRPLVLLLPGKRLHVNTCLIYDLFLKSLWQLQKIHGPFNENHDALPGRFSG